MKLVYKRKTVLAHFTASHTLDKRRDHRITMAHNADPAVNFVRRVCFVLLVIFIIPVYGQCTAIDEQLLQNPLNITTFEMRRNVTVTCVGEKQFYNYTKLTVANLSDNSITSVNQWAFENTKLEILKLQRNSLLDFPNLLIVNKTLRYLDVSFNNITHINVALLHLGRLENLKMNKNMLESWPDFEYAGIFANAKLNVNDNTYLPELEKSTFCHFVTVWLSDNNLTRVPNCVRYADTNIAHLSIQRNRLDDNTNMSVLHTLRGSLTHLFLSGNKFVNFPNLPLAVRSRLLMLKLNSCSISNVNASHLVSFENLKKLELENNLIASVSSSLLRVSEQLHLEHNSRIDHECIARQLNSICWSRNVLVQYGSERDGNSMTLSTGTDETATKDRSFTIKQVCG